MERTVDRADTTTYKQELNYLKRKLEDLEEVHRDGKKQHAAEVEQLMNDHDFTRKANKDRSEQLARLKKQNEIAESRMQDLRKAVSTAQSEARELRVKLRSIEAERDRLASKQTEAVDMRKVLGTAEQRKRNEIQEREKRILELQTALAAEKQRSLEAETKARDDRTKLEKAAREVRVKNTIVEQRLERAQAELKEAVSQRSALERESSSTSHSLTTRVYELEEALKLSTDQYSLLSSSSTPLTAYEELKFEAARLRLQVARLERKLGNSEEQVYELAQLVRQSQATNDLLSEQLQEVHAELGWRCSDSNSMSLPMSVPADDGLEAEVDEFLLDEARDREDEQEQLLDVAQIQLRLGRESSRSLIEHLSSTEHQLTNERAEATRLKGKLSEKDTVIMKLFQESETRKKECDELQAKLAVHSSEIFSLQTKLVESEKKLLAAESRARTELAKREELLRKEKELTSRLQSTVHKSKMAEDALKDEIEQLSSELASADAYREAYQSIAEEMRGLVARNALAEDEANRLSVFNAEILSHRNPTQKILYVDRIRRELAETKQNLVLSHRDQESAVSEIATLREELAMYRSVTVPYEGKPRTAMTRVRRIPLGAQTLNVQAEPLQKESYGYSEGYGPPGDMTMDELS
ncbi:hypothetical protein ACEPAI_7753 [Sanghuangporus weigelae]